MSYKDELVKYLNGVPIKQWIFLTPRYIKKDILLHCNNKRNEYRQMQLEHLHAEFDVLIQDIDFFGEEMRIVFEMTKKRLTIEAENVSSEKIIDWTKSNEIEVKNAFRKITATFPMSQREKSETKISRIVDKRIKEFLKGSTVLTRLENKFPDQFEKFVRVIDDIETEIEEKCMYPSLDNQELFEEIQLQVQRRLLTEFGDVFDSVTINELKRRVISDWIIRCPIDFE